MSKHTPGPWIVNDARDGQSVLFQIESSVQADKPKVIVAMLDDGNASVSEQRANARLIAAAPEMLAALKEVISATDDADWLTRFQSIVTKAEGQL